MSDVAAASQLLDHSVTPVLTKLTELSAGLPDAMVVGAVCRDALHKAAGHDSRLRSTDDLDLAIAVNGWAHFAAITGTLTKVAGAGSTIRHRVAGRTVDLVPFGPPIESPDGSVAPRRASDHAMSVFGFQDVWASAHQVRLSGPLVVRLPTIPGYTVLKLKAWADRSAVGDYKDASDLAAAMYWYQEDSDLIDTRLFGSVAGIVLLETTGFDVPEAAVRLLVADARALLTSGRAQELGDVWQTVDDDLLATYLANPALPGWPRRGDFRLTTYARAIRDVLT